MKCLGLEAEKDYMPEESGAEGGPNALTTVTGKLAFTDKDYR